MRELNIINDVNPFQAKYIKAAEFIKNKLNGRQLVFHGESKLFEELLIEKYGIKVEYISTLIPEKLSVSDRYRFADDFKEKNSEYFIFVPSLEYDDNVKDYFEKNGYKEYEDFMFYYHKPIYFPAGKRIDFHNEYGINIISNGAFSISVGKGVWNCDLYIDENVKAGSNSRILVENSNNHIRIGEKVKFGINCIMILRENASIEIGKFSTFWDNIFFDAAYMSQICIGEDSMFSRDITILPGDGHSIFDVNTGNRLNSIWPMTDEYQIKIGNHVWVGINCNLLKCSINDSSIVGAGSLVKGNFSNNVCIAGVPAKVIKKDVTWSRNAYANSIEDCNPEWINLTREEKQ